MMQAPATARFLKGDLSGLMTLQIEDFARMSRLLSHGLPTDR